MKDNKNPVEVKGITLACLIGMHAWRKKSDGNYYCINCGIKKK